MSSFVICVREELYFQNEQCYLSAYATYLTYLEGLLVYNHN